MRVLLAFVSALGLLSSALSAEPVRPWKTVEERAQHDARIFNGAAAQFVEGATVAVRAEAQGKQVVYTHTVRREPPFTPEMLDGFKTHHDAMVLGIACSGYAKDVDFRNGLSTRSVFQDEQGVRLHELVVDLPTCERR